MENRITNILRTLAKWILVLSSLFAMYTSGFGLLSALTQRSIHWILMSIPIFILYPMFKKRKRGITLMDGLLAAIAAVSGVYLALTWESNALRIEEPSLFETAMGILMILVVLEGTRRTMGPAMSIIAIVFLLYAFLGPYLPSTFRHKGFDVVSLVSFLYSTTEGIFSLPMGTSATYIIIFVLFGSFLTKSGAGQLFVDLAYSVTGKIKSGPAQTTILSNALMGIISGSPVANVVTTGSFAMPLLNRAGYPVVTGAALLAVAATGSMFTPPVMGAGAFMIADYLSVGYSEVVKAAIIPATLFYLSLVVYADIAAARSGLKGISKEEVPYWKTGLTKRGHLLVPIIALVIFIVVGWSAIKAAFWTTLLILALSWIRSETQMNFKKIISALEAGSRDNLVIAAACASAGIIVGVISSTGLGVKFSSLLIDLSGNIPFLALVLTMIAALILGMGLPPTAVYIILAALTVPSLIRMGIHPMAAHFFVFFFACIGAITPPVCLAAYAAAGLAKTDPWPTGWRAFRMGLVGYIVPFLFVANPVLLLAGKSVSETIQAVITAMIGVIALCFGVEGYFRKPLPILLRFLLVAGALGLMIPGTKTDLIGAGLLLLAAFYYRFVYKRGMEKSPLI
jgi:TRAP transporter 4TM/12TM fusion protein